METPSLFASGYGLGEGRQLEPNRAVEEMKTLFHAISFMGTFQIKEKILLFHTGKPEFLAISYASSPLAITLCFTINPMCLLHRDPG